MGLVVQHCEAFVGGCISIKHKGNVPPLPPHVIEINQRCVQSVGQTQQIHLRYQYMNKTQKSSDSTNTWIHTGFMNKTCKIQTQQMQVNGFKEYQNGFMNKIHVYKQNIKNKCNSMHTCHKS